jgi:type VI secretion system protein ImpK
VASRSLGRIAGDLFAYVGSFHGAPDARAISPAALRSELLGLLEAVRQDPDARVHPPEEIDEACFALVAFADEMVLRTPWIGHDEWAREPLQLQLYRTNKAGDEFYEHLERMHPEMMGARLVYFLCLALGFEGQYAGHDADRRALMARQYELLRVAGQAIEPGGRDALVPPAYELDIEIEPARGRRLWPALLGVTVVTAGLYALLWFLLRSFAGSVPAPPDVVIR